MTSPESNRSVSAIVAMAASATLFIASGIGCYWQFSQAAAFSRASTTKLEKIRVLTHRIEQTEAEIEVQRELSRQSEEERQQRELDRLRRENSVRGKLIASTIGQVPDVPRAASKDGKAALLSAKRDEDKSKVAELKEAAKYLHRRSIYSRLRGQVLLTPTILLALLPVVFVIVRRHLLSRR